MMVRSGAAVFYDGNVFHIRISLSTPSIGMFFG